MVHTLFDFVKSVENFPSNNKFFYELMQYHAYLDLNP